MLYFISDWYKVALPNYRARRAGIALSSALAGVHQLPNTQQVWKLVGKMNSLLFAQNKLLKFAHPTGASKPKM